MAEKKAKPKHTPPSVADVETDALKSFHQHRLKSKRMKELIASGKIKKNPTARDFDDWLASLMPESIKIPQSRELEPDSELWGRSIEDKVKRIRARNKKKAAKKKSGDTAKLARGGMTRVGLSPAEEKRSGTASQAARRRNMKKGGTAKLAAGGQGYSAREDESLGMRTGPERTKSQSMAARRDESYGDWGKRRRGRVNVKKGGSIGIALRGGGAVVR